MDSTTAILFLLLLSPPPALPRSDPPPSPIITAPSSVLMEESLRAQRAQACEGQRVVLKCPLHTNINIVNTFYGRLVPSAEHCPPTGKQLKKQKRKKKGKVSGGWEEEYEDTSCDVTNAKAKIVAECQNRRKCKLRAKAEMFGRDPCPTTSKYLQVAYKCQPSQFHSKTTCEGNSMQLRCRNKRQRIALYSGVYGQRTGESEADCDQASQPIDHDCTVDVVKKLMERCHAQSECSLAVEDGVLGNPCPHKVHKYLRVVYMCVNGNVFSDAALKGELLELEEEEPEMDPGLVGPPLPPPVPPPSTQSTLNNDPPYLPPFLEPDLPPLHTSTPGPDIPYLPPSTCLPPEIPNAVGFMQSWILTASYMRTHREELILYFCLSASVGLILLLGFSIVRQCGKGSGERERKGREGVEGEGPPLIPPNYDLLHSSTHSATPVPERERMEMVELGRNGVSFMRFNHPTPPAMQSSIPHHYYA